MNNEGTVNIYVKGNPLPVEHVEIVIEDYSEDADQVASAVNSIRNKCQAIDSLLESIVADLGLIELIHIDDNGKELAQALKRKFQRLESDYYWNVIEKETDSSDENCWMASSLVFWTSLLANPEKQCLVLPKLREFYQEVIKGEEISEADRQAEIAAWIEYIRNDFNLSKDFK